MNKWELDEDGLYEVVIEGLWNKILTVILLILWTCFTCYLISKNADMREELKCRKVVESEVKFEH